MDELPVHVDRAEVVYGKHALRNARRGAENFVLADPVRNIAVVRSDPPLLPAFHADINDRFFRFLHIDRSFFRHWRSLHAGATAKPERQDLVLYGRSIFSRGHEFP
jgi:hypothetical protein